MDQIQDIWYTINEGTKIHLISTRCDVATFPWIRTYILCLLNLLVQINLREISINALIWCTWISQKKQNLKCKRNTSEKHYELIFIYYLLIQFQLSASPPAKFCFCLLDVHVHIINILIGNYETKRDAVKKKTGYLMTLCKIHLIPTHLTKLWQNI